MSKRKILCIVLSLMMLFSSMPINAASTDGNTAGNIGKEAAACRDLQILIGSDASGVTPAYLSTTPNRAQALIIFLRLRGLYQAAGSEAFDTNFKDADTLPWAKAYTAYAKNNPSLGWVGNPDGTFAPTAKIDAKGFYKVMLEALSYNQNIDFAYKDTLIKAEAVGLIKDASAMAQKSSFTINDVAIAIYNTLNSKIKGSDKKLIDAMIEEKIISAENALKAGFVIETEAVNVKSFKVINNNKLKLEFEKDIAVSRNDISIAAEGTNASLAVSSVESVGNITTITTSDAAAFSKYIIKINTRTPVNNLAVKNYENIYIAPPKDNVRPTALIEVTDSNEITATFSEEVDRTTAENILKYSIQNDLPIKEARLDSTGKKVIITTQKDQTEGYLYWITIQGVQDLAGNSMDKLEQKFAGIARDTTKPYIVSLASETNKSISITFSKKVNEVTAQNTSNYIIDRISILDAKLQEDGKTVKLTTTQQSASEVYRVVIQDIADKNGIYMERLERRFTGSAGDSTKPKATALVIASNEIMVRYSEKVDKVTAENVSNYTIDKGLQVLKAVLDDSGRIASLLTTKQTPGTLYTIGISGVSDLYGNVIDYYTSQFGGMSEDATPLNFTVSSAGNAVVVTFNKRVDRASAENNMNYVFDNNLGSPLKATLDSTGKIVTLQTGQQTNGKLYSVTVKNVTDSFGNAITADDNISRKFFIGTGIADMSTASLKTIVTVDSSTIDLIFDTVLTEEELDDMSVIIATENDKYFTPPAGLQYAKYFVSDKSTVRVQFKTADSTVPALFASGKVYELRIGDLDRLKTDTKTCIFAGTSKVKKAPRIEEVNPINSTAIEVTFSEPVKGLTTSSFSINGITIDKLSVEQNEVVSSVMLYLRTALSENKEYTIYPRSTIRDGAGYNSIQMKNDSDYTYYKTFYGINASNDAPQISEVVAINRYMLNIKFSEPVQNADSASYSIRKISGSGTTANLYIVKAVAGKDKKEANLYLNANTSGLSDGGVYELYSGSVIDLQGKSLDSASRKIQFAGISTEAPRLEIIASSISQDNKTITLSFSNEINASGASLNWLQLSGAGYYPSSSDKITLSESKKIITIELKYQLQGNDKLTIKITDTGKSEMTDYNRQKLSTEELVINTR